MEMVYKGLTTYMEMYGGFVEHTHYINISKYKFYVINYTLPDSSLTLHVQTSVHFNTNIQYWCISEWWKCASLVVTSTFSVVESSNMDLLCKPAKWEHVTKDCLICLLVET